MSQRRANANLVFTAAVVTLGANFQLYNTAVVNNVQLICEEWVNSTFIERYSWTLDDGTLNIFWSLLTCAVAMGGTLGSCFTRTAAEKLGRRRALIVSCIVNIVGLLLTSFAKMATSYEMIVIGRFLIGVSVGVGFANAGVFLSEIPPVRYRGTVGAAQHLLVGFSDFFSLAVTLPVLLGTEYLWPVAFGLPVLPSIVLLVSLIFVCPESPRFLYLTRKAKAKAEASVLFYQGNKRVHTTMLELKSEDEATQARSKRVVRFRDMFAKAEYRKPLVISVVAMLGMTLTGIQVVMAYSTDIFIAARLEPEVAQYATVGVGFCNFAVPLVSMCVIENAGRRPLILTMFAGDAVALSALSVFTYLSNEYKYEWAPYLTIAALVLFQSLFAAGASVVWIIANELFETHTRSHAASITSFLYWLSAFIMTLLYLPFKEAVGISWSFTPFIVSCVFCFIYLFVFLPETKGKTSDTIAALFRQSDQRLTGEKTTGTGVEENGMGNYRVVISPTFRDSAPTLLGVSKVNADKF